MLITLVAMIVAIPLGLAAAIYLAEYARPAVRKTIKPILELLAGVPTIVFGYFALTFFTPEILRGLFGDGVGIFAAGGGHHHRLPDRADGGVHLRGLDVGRAAVPA